jgi:hypothetical protein
LIFYPDFYNLAALRLYEADEQLFMSRPVASAMLRMNSTEEEAITQADALQRVSQHSSRFLRQGI